MIDFDEIENEEQVIVAQEQVDEARRKQEEEERLNKEEAARFKYDLYLEQEIERRCQVTDGERAEESDGILGVRLACSSGANFVEGLNESLLTIGRQFVKHRSEHPSYHFLHRGTAAIIAFINALMQCRFGGGVVPHLDQLQSLFAKPKTGLCAILLFALSTPPEVKEANQWHKLSPCFLQIFACLRRALCWVTTRRRPAREALTAAFNMLAGFFSAIIGEVRVPEWPSVDTGDALEVTLRFSPTGAECPVKVRPGHTVEDLTRLLVECWALPPAIKLCGQGRTKTEPLHPATKLRSIRSPIIVLDSSAPAPDAPVNSPGEPGDAEAESGGQEDDEDEEGAAKEKKDGRLKDYVVEHAQVAIKVVATPWLPPDFTPVAGVGWVGRWHIVKTTPLDVTRLLHELRRRFHAPEFQETYKELRMRMRHIDCALKVQQSVLPSYGFADTIAGVNDMRGEVTYHESLFMDYAVMKLRKEIHSLLEYGEPPRKMPITRAITPPRIPFQHTAVWMQHLADEGYAVIANVASQAEVDHAYGLLWDFIEASDVTGRISRKEMNTWFDAMGHDRGWPGERDDGIIHTRGIGQSEVLWYLRNLPALRGAFATIWGTDDLVCSFDGAGVFRPYGQFEGWRTTKKNWFHVDQTHKRRGLHCIQGLLNMKNASRETGGLVVVPRSHRFYGDVLRRYDEPGSQDSLHLDVTDPVLTEGDTGPRLVCAGAGDLVVWDSRTVHCNTPPLVDDATLLNGTDLIRAVAYICMTPAGWCTKEVADRRQMAVQAGITTTHVPHAYRPMDIPERFPALQLSREQKRLVAGLSAVGEGKPKDDTMPLVLPQLGPNNLEQKKPAGAAIDGKQKDDSVPPPGRISFLPEKKFQVVGGNGQVRGSATMEWGSVQGTLSIGAVVAGYTFGEWLRLASWAEGAFSSSQDSRGEHDELWVPMKWGQGHLEPLAGNAWTMPFLS